MLPISSHESLVLSLPRIPKTLKNDYERIANYNNWDETARVANVVFYLSGTARLWFGNNEDRLKSWIDSKKLFEETFGRPEGLKSFAEGLLRTRAQRPGETHESYVQDVLSLCRKVDKNMPEDQKISHLMKGVAEDLYQELINREVSTVDKFVACCREVDAMRKK
ncbi:retrotrans_gag domain-containing protein [Trichonephila inaurata madagascariensis]|uniref:Retrotrans_gag domain-containing protein n=1 Tax=Trichonephila inaurata madagascariensis TaxID=2747483 RepID=A0A8X6YV84_9ARAC|nr:retrotrans_gag domain-containing protein [Trichonephila inaurata madagascariensis]